MELDSKTRKLLEEEARKLRVKLWGVHYDLYEQVITDALAPYVEMAEQLEDNLRHAKADADKCAESAEIFRKRAEHLEIELLGTSATTGVGSEVRESAPVAKEILELYKLFPSNSHMSVGHRAEEGYHVEFSCLDVADVKKLAEQFIHKSVIEEVREIKWPEPRAIDATDDVTLKCWGDGWNEFLNTCIAAYNAARPSPAPGVVEALRSLIAIRDSSDPRDMIDAMNEAEAALASHEPLKPWQAISTKSEQSKGPLASSPTNNAAREKK